MSGNTSTVTLNLRSNLPKKKSLAKIAKVRQYSNECTNQLDESSQYVPSANSLDDRKHIDTSVNCLNEETNLNCSALLPQPYDNLRKPTLKNEYQLYDKQRDESACKDSVKKFNEILRVSDNGFSEKATTENCIQNKKTSEQSVWDIEKKIRPEKQNLASHLIVDDIDNELHQLNSTDYPNHTFETKLITPNKSKTKDCQAIRLSNHLSNDLFYDNNGFFSDNSSTSNSNIYSDTTIGLGPSSGDEISQSANSVISSVSVLPPITTYDARKRSYLVGSISGHHSLLGADELARYFPEQKIKIFVGTWNMNEKTVSNLDEFLLPHDILYLPDIYVICTQESIVDKKEWEIKVQSTIGPSHVLFHTATIGVLYLLIFMRRDLVWFCSIPEESSFTTRPITAIKTKGGIGVGFVFFGTSLLFITSHLSAHDYRLKEREVEYNKIRTGLQLPKYLATKAQHFNKDVTARYDCVFWCGDLNYRITTEHSIVMKILNEKGTDGIKTLLHGDQLKNQMKIGKVFKSFEEPEIKFLPSYKYDIGSDVFDSSQKLRTPSYTDRILFRSRKKNSINCLIYNSISSIQSSDHKPVYGLFNVAIRPGKDNISLSAGLFNRDVYLEGIKIRSMHLVAKNPKSDSSAVCSIM